MLLNTGVAPNVKLVKNNFDWHDFCNDISATFGQFSDILLRTCQIMCKVFQVYYDSVEKEVILSWNSLENHSQICSAENLSNYV